MQAYPYKIADHRWAVILDYTQNRNPLAVSRDGVWVEDRAGGWGVSGFTAEAAIEQCYEGPVTYRTRREAQAEADARNAVGF